MGVLEQTDGIDPRVGIADPDAVPSKVHQSHVRARIERGCAGVRDGRVRHAEAFLEELEHEPE